MGLEAYLNIETEVHDLQLLKEEAEKKNKEAERAIQDAKKATEALYIAVSSTYI